MEYMDCGSLEQFLQANKPTFDPNRPGGLPAANLLSVLLDVANAMNYLHLSNYVHRVSVSLDNMSASSVLKCIP